MYIRIIRKKSSKYWKSAEMYVKRKFDVKNGNIRI